MKFFSVILVAIYAVPLVLAIAANDNLYKRQASTPSTSVSQTSTRTTSSLGATPTLKEDRFDETKSSGEHEDEYEEAEEQEEGEEKEDQQEDEKEEEKEEDEKEKEDQYEDEKENYEEPKGEPPYKTTSETSSVPIASSRPVYGALKYRRAPSAKRRRFFEARNIPV